MKCSHWLKSSWLRASWLRASWLRASWFKTAGSLLLLAAGPASAVTVDVSFVSLTSTLNGEMHYLAMPGKFQGDPETARLVMDLRLTANEPNIEVYKVDLDFENPNSSRSLQADLRLRCPAPSGTGQVVMGFEDGLKLTVGHHCRLALFENGADPVLTDIPERIGIRVYFTKNGEIVWEDPLVVPTMNLVPYVHTTPFGAYRFPAKADDLESGQYWFGSSPIASHNHRFSPEPSNIYAYDLSVFRKLDPGEEGVPNNDGWVYYHKPTPTEIAEKTARDENSDFLAWGYPLYGMADGGLVDRCEDDNDDQVPGEQTTEANYIEIKYGEEIVRYSHIQKGSATAAGVCSEGTDVDAGQLVARVGNNGLSSAPHLHIEIIRDGQPVPVQFRDMYVMERSAEVFPNAPTGNGPWAEMDRHGFGFSDHTIAWPSPLRRRGDVTDAAITATSLVQVLSQDLISASRTQAGNLRVSLWRTGTDGEIVLDDTEDSGGVSRVSMTRPWSSSHGALAMITAAGTLKLAGYRVVGNVLTREGELSVGPATEVATAEGNFTRGFVTALRLASGSFKIIAWQLDTTVTPWQFVRRGEDVGGAVQQVAITKTTNFPGVVTAVRLGNNRLKLMSYRLSSNGDLVTRMGEMEDALIEQVSVARIGTLAGNDLVVTASKTLAGHLELVAWSISPVGVISRLGDLQGPEIDEVSIARATEHSAIGSYRDAAGKLNTVLWQIDGSGFFRRRTRLVAGTASAIHQTPLYFQFPGINAPYLVVTGMKDGGGNLKLISHQLNLQD